MLALADIDKIIELAPDYVEGWNQRATVLFMLGRDTESVRDIQQVLRIEPRHFGALAGLGLIHMRASNWQAAIKSRWHSAETPLCQGLTTPFWMERFRLGSARW